MTNGTERDLIEAILRRNRYLVLATTDGATPWAAPLEYMIDDELNFYFFSTNDSRHVRDLGQNSKVAVTVFDTEQPEYSADASFTLGGVQMEATATEVPSEEYSDDIVAAIEALKPPMPPYVVFKIVPSRFYLPKVEGGINIRTEVPM